MATGSGEDSCNCATQTRWLRYVNIGTKLKLTLLAVTQEGLAKDGDGCDSVRVSLSDHVLNSDPDKTVWIVGNAMA